MVRRLLMALALALCPGFLGCGGPRHYPVEGVVVLPDGKPLSGGVLGMERKASEPKDRLNFMAEIDAEGRFRLMAREGEYRVLLGPLQEGTAADYERKNAVAAIYTAYETSPLTIVVTSEPERNQVRLELKKE